MSSLEDRIDAAFQELYERLASGLPGPPQQSLAGLFAAGAGTSTHAARRRLEPYLRALKFNLDARCATAKAELVRASESPDKNQALRAAMERIAVGVRRVLESEGTAVRNLSMVAAAEDAVEDREVVIYFVTRPDACVECRRLFWAGDRPRAWSSSELGTEYHARGDSTPKLGGCHPNCRCSLVALPSGYGFKSGKIAYIGRDHDELAQQRLESA